MKNKEKGMTLVEVLAVLVLTSLVIMLIWTTVLTSMKYQANEMKKLKMQQEVNYFITELQQIHRKNPCYIITMPSKKEIDVKMCNNNKEISNFQSEEYLWTLGGGVSIDTPIYTKSQAGINNYDITTSYNITVEVQDSVKEKLKITVNSQISRYSLQGIE